MARWYFCLPASKSRQKPHRLQFQWWSHLHSGFSLCLLYLSIDPVLEYRLSLQIPSFALSSLCFLLFSWILSIARRTKDEKSRKPQLDTLHALCLVFYHIFLHFLYTFFQALIGSLNWTLIFLTLFANGFFSSFQGELRLCDMYQLLSTPKQLCINRMFSCTSLTCSSKLYVD